MAGRPAGGEAGGTAGISWLRWRRRRGRLGEMLLKMLMTTMTMAVRGDATCSVDPRQERVRGVVASEVDLTSVLISWDGRTGVLCAKYVQVLWKRQDTLSWEAGEIVGSSVGSIRIGGLEGGTVYSVRVQTVTSDGYGIPEDVTVETRDFLKATNLFASTDNKSTSATLTWLNATISEQYLQSLLSSEDQGLTWNNIVAIPVCNLNGSYCTQTVNGLKSMQAYQFRVETSFKDAKGVLPSIPSNRIVILDTYPPGSVSLQSVNSTSFSVTITWTDLSPISSIKQHLIEIILASQQFPDPNPISSSSSNIATLSNLPKNTQFSVRVSIVDIYERTSLPSQPLLISTLPTLPGKINLPTANISNQVIVLTWMSLKSNNETGGLPILSYRIYGKRSDETSFTRILEFTPSSSIQQTANVQSTVAGFAYQFIVTAVNSVGEGLLGTPSVSITSPISPMISSPHVNIITSKDSCAANVSWGSVFVQSQGYIVSMQDLFAGQGVPFDAGIVLPADQRSYLYSNLSQGFLYTFRVVQFADHQTASQYSIPVTVETPDSSAPTSVRADSSGLAITVQWVAPLLVNDISMFQIFQVDEAGQITMLSTSSSTLSLTVQGVVGKQYKFAVQTRYVNGSGSRVSLWSPNVSIPATVPLPVSAPTLQLVSSCSRCILVSWTFSNVAPTNGGNANVSFEVQDSVDSITVPTGDVRSVTLTNLRPKLFHQIAVRVKNNIGSSSWSSSSSIFLPATYPDAPTNLQVVVGSYQVVSGIIQVSLSWSVPLSGDDQKLVSYRLYNTTILNDLDQGTVITVAYGNANNFTVKNLVGGIEYTFRLKAINSQNLEGPSSNSVFFVAGEVAPLAMPAPSYSAIANPDTGSYYKVQVSWVTPTSTRDVGGTALLNLVLQYSNQSSTISQPSTITDWKTLCTPVDASYPCLSSGKLSVVSSIQFIVIKGTYYYLRIAAQNSVGLGAFSDVLSIPPFFTVPTQPPAPNLIPATNNGVSVGWESYDAACSGCYLSKTVNGGRVITNLQVMINLGDGVWRMLNDTVVGAARATGIIYSNEDIYSKKRFSMTLYGTNYSFRIRASNDNMATWSLWSPTSTGTTLTNTFANLNVSSGSPPTTCVFFEWYYPSDFCASGCAVLYFGRSSSSLQAAQVDVSISYSTSHATGTLCNLIPGSSYYFQVRGNQSGVSYSSSIFGPLLTTVAVPSSSISFSVQVLLGSDPSVGSVLVQWADFSSSCSAGPINADGSISACPRGGPAETVRWQVYMRLSGTAYGSALVELEESKLTYQVTGLLKGSSYCFTMRSRNSVLSSNFATEQCLTGAFVTVPAAPPPPFVPTASLTSLRVSFRPPSDLGASYAKVKNFLLTMTPGRTSVSEQFQFDWQRSTIVTGLQANSQYKFDLRVKNDLVDSWSEASLPTYGQTVSLPPAAVQVSGTAATSVSLALSPPPVAQQGSNIIYGYKVLYSSSALNGSFLCANDGFSTCQVSSLLPGIRYDIKVSTSNDPLLLASFGPPSSSVFATTQAYAPIIGQPTVSGVDWQSVYVSWTSQDSGSPLSSYTIVASSGTFERTFQSSSSPFLATGLGSSRVYTFTVTGSNQLGTATSPPSAPFLLPPAAPQRPSFVEVHSRSVVVSLSSSSRSADVTSLELQYKTSPSSSQYESSLRLIRNAAWTSMAPVPSSQQQLTISGLASSSQVQVRIRAQNPTGLSTWSEIASTTTMQEAPSLPYVEQFGAKWVLLKWTPPTGAKNFYTIIISMWNGSSFLDLPPFQKQDGAADSQNLTALLKGTRYRFKVAVLRLDGGVSDFSVQTDDITTLSTVPSSGPALSFSSDVGVSWVVVQWTSDISWEDRGGEPLLSYELQVREESQMWTVAISRSFNLTSVNSSAGMSQVNFTGLVGNTRYAFRLSLRNSKGGGGYGPDSDLVITRPLAPPPPSTLSSLQSVLVSWVSNVNFDGFKVRGYRVDSSVETLIGEKLAGKTETSILFSGLALDKEYRFSLAVRNAAGWGDFSSKKVTRTTLAAFPLRPTAITIIQDTSATLNWITPNDVQSTIGFLVYACEVVDRVTGLLIPSAARVCTPPPALVSCQAGVMVQLCIFPLTGGSIPSSLTRTGLRRNTNYTLRLSVANPGGEGPLGQESEVFTTYSTFPDRMAAVRVDALTSNELLARWTPLVGWDERGGLPVFAYYVKIVAVDYNYSKMFSVFPSNSSDPAEAQLVISDLLPNSLYDVTVLAENTNCLVQEGKVIAGIDCCADHVCSPLSPATRNSTLMGTLPIPFIRSATGSEILVGWNAIQGSISNLLEIQVEYQDADRSSKFSTDQWFSVQEPGDATSVLISDLLPNNAYNVRIRTLDIFRRLGPYSDTAVLITIPQKIGNLTAEAIGSSSAHLSWSPPLGRSKNLIGFNISIQEVSQLSPALSPLPIFIIVNNIWTDYIVTQLKRNTQYIFQVAPINFAGQATFSDPSLLIRTAQEDEVVSCSFFGSALHKSISGNVLIQRVSSAYSIQGKVNNIAPGIYKMFVSPTRISQSYNWTATGSLLQLQDFDASLTLSELYANKQDDASYTVNRSYTSQVGADVFSLYGSNSYVGGTVAIVTNNEMLAQCQLGISRPSPSQINAVASRPSSFAFCQLQPTQTSLANLSGIVLLQQAENNLVIVRARICGLPSSLTVTLSLNDFGDLTDKPQSLGSKISLIGDMSFDNLGSGNLFNPSSSAVSLDATSPLSAIGRSMSVYETTDLTLVATCVIGRDEATTSEEFIPPCTPCTYALNQEDTFVSVATMFGVNWMDVWSLNIFLHPDRAPPAGTSVFYAHPYQLRNQEDVNLVAKRFGVTFAHLEQLNPGLFLPSLIPGDVLCVSSNWSSAYDRNGNLVCT